jgi:ribonuclease VapC
MTVVLDASALLAYLQQEAGSELVDALLSDALMASVNWAEVVQKSISAGVDVTGMRKDLQALCCADDDPCLTTMPGNWISCAARTPD